MRDWLWLIGMLLIYAAVVVLVGVALHRVVDAAELRPGELELLARVVQSESTGEPAAGARAVAWTALNRLNAGTYGKTLTAVLRAPRQYAKPARPSNGPAYQRALQAAAQAVLGEGPFPATHFYRCSMARPPAWARRLPRVAVIGRHCFHRRR
jgi:spore germination cell wall hydrolase CwlJ-like protein